MSLQCIVCFHETAFDETLCVELGVNDPLRNSRGLFLSVPSLALCDKVIIMKSSLNFKLTFFRLSLQLPW